MENNYEKRIMKSNTFENTQFEDQESGCKNCKKSKKGCRMCKKSKKKFGWLFFWSIYIIIFAIFGHIQFFKFVMSFF